MRANTTSGSSILAWSGLLIAPPLWAAVTELGEILPSVQCGNRFPLLAMIALFGSLLSVLAAGVSLVLLRRGHGDNREQPDTARIGNFGGGVSGLAGLIFALVMLFQGSASLLLTGCER